MRFVYPADTFKPKQVDEFYADECAAAQNAGFATSLFNFEDFQAGRFRPSPAFQDGDSILYRGWMMDEAEYLHLHDSFVAHGGRPLTSPEPYLLCHHLPRWYPLLRQFTAETRFYSESDNICADLASAGWGDCFVKDYVKSLSTDGGSVAKDLASIPTVISKMRKYRGRVEGGVCTRRLEQYDPATERRFFVYQGKAMGDGETPPSLVVDAAAIISSPFFTVDVAKRTDGVLRIIELGDGQVSDRKHWNSKDFIQIFALTQ